MIKENLSKLTEQDTYSMLMFILWKLHEDKKYSTLSEMSYVLDMDNMLKFCEYFGGKTIDIPTLDDITEIIYILLIYNETTYNNKSFDEAMTFLKISDKPLIKRIKTNYINVCQILEDFDFRHRETV